MSDRDLKIRLIFEGQDKLSKKIGNLFDASKRLKGQMAETRDIQRGLEAAMARSQAFEKQAGRVKEYQDKLAAANEKLAARKEALAAVDKPNQKMIQGLLAAERLTAKASASLSREEAALAQVAGEMQRAGMATDNLAQQQADLKARIEKTKASMESLAASQKRFGKLRQQEIAARERGKANVMGGGMQLAAAAAASMPMLQVARSAGNFQSGMVDIQQTANLSDKDTAALAANIRRAALATYAPLTNLQGALQSLVAMGMDPRIATGMLRPIGTMATTYKLEAEDAAKASFAAYDNLKVPINQSAQAMETMVAAAKAGKVEVADMAKVFPSLTGSAQTLGMTGIKAVAQLGAALQIAGKTARDADEAGNNVNNLLNKLGDNETLKNFKNFGIDAKAAYAAGTAAGATQLETMIALLEKVKAKGGTVNDIFGDMQARAAAAALLANKAEFNKIATTAGGSKGMIQQDLGKRLANDPLAQQAALMSRLGDAGITIGTHLLPPLTALAEKAAALTERFATFANQNPRLMAMLSNIAVYALAASAGVGTLRLGFGMFSYAAHGVLATWRIGASLFSAMPTIFSTAGMALNTLRTGFTAFRTGMMAARVASMAFAASNPVFLILTGLALLALAAYNHWDKIVGAFNWAKDKIMAIGEWFKNIGAMMIDGLILGFTNTYERVKAKITAVPEKLANLFRNKLGIRSPSRLFAEYGGHLMTGLANGIDGGAGGPLARIGRLSRDMTAALAVGAGLAGPAAAAPPGVAGGAAGGGVVQNITITIVQQPGQSGPDLARMIAAELDKRQRAAGAARRSGFGDYGE